MFHISVVEEWQKVSLYMLMLMLMPYALCITYRTCVLVFGSRKAFECILFPYYSVYRVNEVTCQLFFNFFPLICFEKAETHKHVFFGYAIFLDTLNILVLTISGLNHSFECSSYWKYLIRTDIFICVLKTTPTIFLNLFNML